jgi:uncharacterized protein YdeI (YjbR/CyaY-like superfamily)
MKTPVFFENPGAFEQWLEDNHQTAEELIVGFLKTKADKPSVTWAEAVDLALCFGWIDGVRKSLDQDRYQIRFTPRKKGSTWSARNIERYKVLNENGKTRPMGQAAYAHRREDRSKKYSYEQEKSPELEENELDVIRSNPESWRFYLDLSPSYRTKIIHWITSAKQTETRGKRFSEFFKACSEGRRL